MSAADFRTEAGFTLGDIYIDGAGEYAGSNYRIAVKNENMLAWRDGDLEVTIPDLICLLDMDKGESLTNPNPVRGMNVAVVVSPAPEAFLTEKGLAVFGPAYMGLDVEYRAAVG